VELVNGQEAKPRLATAPVDEFVRDPQAMRHQVIYRGQRHLRVRLPHLPTEVSDTDRLQQSIAVLPGVTAVRLNRVARSLSVEYDDSLIASTGLEVAVLHCCDTALGADLRPQTETIVLTQTRQTVGHQVIHQTPWRIRLRIPRVAEDADYANRLVALANGISGVLEVRLNRLTQSISVEFAPLPLKQVAIARHRLFEVLEEALRTDAGAIITTESQTATTNHELDYWQRLGLPALGFFMGLGTLAGVPIPGILTAGVMLAATIPVFQRAWDGIRQEQQLNIDFLDGLAIGLHTSQGSNFPAALMLGLIEGGEVIRDMTARSSERASLDLLDCLNGEVLVERNGQELRILAKTIEVGDLVFLYPGDQIPVDGCIVRGTALVDQCKLTGESVPVTRLQGEEVFASTLLVDGHVCVLAERLGSNTRAGVILTLVEAAPVHDTRVENYAAMFANQLVIPTLITAGLVGTLSGDLSRAIALLTLDLGTGIRISVPTTILSALTYAARNGVFIRSGRAIEGLAKIDTVVFDKTGTLTQGHAGVTAIRALNAQLSESEILSLAATAEKGLTHPIAEAIVRHARDTGAPLYDCQTWEYRVGLGVVATVNGMRLLVGSHRLMLQEEISLETLWERHPDLQFGSHAPVYIAGNGELLGVILYNDPPRPESQTIIKELRDLGINSYMLSGDVTRVANAVAQELGIAPDCIYAEAFPERKVEVVQALHDSGKTVAFCGDGINDSAALAYADVSISFAGATDIARETADVVLMENDLHGLINAIRIARQAMDIIWQNTALVAIPNLSAVGAGVLFALDPVLAIIINNGSAILAELNGLRPLLGPGDLPSLQHSLNPTALLQEITRWQENPVAPTNPEPETLISQDGGLNNGHSLEPTLPEMEAVLSDHCLSQKDLAKRLGVTTRTLSRRRSSPTFDRWSQTKDPERLSWEFQASSRLFYVRPPAAKAEKRLSLTR